MFDSFGIMTTEELNELANNLKNEGDKDSIKALAKENGLDPDIAKASYPERYRYSQTYYPQRSARSTSKPKS